MMYPGPLLALPDGAEGVSGADCSHCLMVGITTSQVREGAAQLAATPAQTLSVTPDKQQRTSMPQGPRALPPWPCTAAAS